MTPASSSRWIRFLTVRAETSSDSAISLAEVFRASYWSAWMIRLSRSSIEKSESAITCVSTRYI